MHNTEHINKLIFEISNIITMASSRHEDPSKVLATMNLVFTGSPGTGKTFVARKFGELFKRLNLLYKGHVIETTPSKLTDKWVGGTAPKVLCSHAIRLYYRDSMLRS